LPNASGILGKDEVDHEPDHLARREVLAGRLIGQFGKLANQFLEDRAHVGIADPVRVKVDLAELLGDEVEQVGIGKSVDLRFQLEAGEDVFDVGRKAVKVSRKVHRDVILVANDGLQVHRRSVVKGIAGRASQIMIDAVPRDVALGGFLQNGLLRRLKDAVHPAQNCKRENHLAILMGLVLATQQVRH
jgi:hypothetical protein